jgi:hypothetical protein
MLHLIDWTLVDYISKERSQTVIHVNISDIMHITQPEGSTLSSKFQHGIVICSLEAQDCRRYSMIPLLFLENPKTACRKWISF